MVELNNEPQEQVGSPGIQEQLLIPLSTMWQQKLDAFAVGNYQNITAISCIYCPLQNSQFQHLEITRAANAIQFYNSLIQSSNIARLGKLLAYLSDPTLVADDTSNFSLSQLTLKPLANSGHNMVSVEIRLANMMRVCNLAHKYIRGSSFDAELARLKLLVAYTMQYITLEYGILPMILEQNPRRRRRWADGQKLQVFCDQLNSLEGIEVDIVSLTEQVRYGKVYWEMAQQMGIIILPMLAVVGPGVTQIARDHTLTSLHIETVASRLSANTTWMSMCCSWGPVAVEVIFSTASRKYTAEKLLILLVAEPLCAAIRRGLFEKYLDTSKGIPPRRTIGIPLVYSTLNSLSASSVLSQFGLNFQIFATDKYPNPGKHQIDLVAWLLAQREDLPIKLGSDPDLSGQKLATIPLSQFATLLPGDNISDNLVTFIAICWNQKALPGWAMLGPCETNYLLGLQLDTSLLTTITQVLGGTRFNLPYENIILSVTIHEFIFPVLLCFLDSTITVYKTCVTPNFTLEPETLVEVSTHLYKLNKKLIDGVDFRTRPWASELGNTGKDNWSRSELRYFDKISSMSAPSSLLSYDHHRVSLLL